MAMDFAQQSISMPKEKIVALGSHRSTESTSFAAIGATLVPVLMTACFFLATFLYLRKPYRNIYAPRTYFQTISEKDRTPSSSRAALSWYHDFRSLDDKFLLRHSSLDAYLFIRFLRMTLAICFVGCCLTWPILFPVNATAGGGATQLDLLSFSNIDDPKRLYAHAVVAWLFLGFIILLVTRERLFAIGLRQAHTTIKGNALRLSSRVVLFLAVPKEALEAANMKRVFGANVIKTWPAPNLQKLESLVAERNNKLECLEVAELALEKRVNHAVRKRDIRAEANGSATKLSRSVTRPQHHDYFIFGESHDTIDTLRKEIPETVAKIQAVRDSNSKGPDRHNIALFVEFKDQLCAQQAYQEVTYHSPLHLQPRYISVLPKEVLWDNLNIDPSLRITYSYVATALIVATIILWSIPIGIIGTVSNIKYLADKVRFLNWVNNLPDPILGFLTGFVPAFILSEVVSYVPNFFRYVAKQSGQPTTVEAEKLTQKWYFAFQVIQVFLVTTFTSGAATVATKIANEPASVPRLLAKNLPKASNFYLSYFILQGLATSAKNIANYWDLSFYLLYDKFVYKTPRQKYNGYSSMKGIGWGKAYPKFANLAVIAIAYSCIAPLVLGFATIGLYCFYLQYKYNFLYVIQVKTDTRGACYSVALQHLLTGVYLSELCLIGLFSIRKASGPLAMMIVLLVATFIHHITVNRYLSPLEKFLPLDILYSEDEEEPLLSGDFESRIAAEQRERSRIHRYGDGKLPSVLLDPLAAFLEPHIFASYEALRSWLKDPESDDDGIPEYTEDELGNAYTNPAMTSKIPKVWLPRDAHGISAQAVEENEAVGISSTDKGAELDTHSNVMWNKDDFSTVPIFKIATKY